MEIVDSQTIWALAPSATFCSSKFNCVSFQGRRPFASLIVLVANAVLKTVGLAVEGVLRVLGGMIIENKEEEEEDEEDERERDVTINQSKSKWVRVSGPQ